MGWSTNGDVGRLLTYCSPLLRGLLEPSLLLESPSQLSPDSSAPHSAFFKVQSGTTRLVLEATPGQEMERVGQLDVITLKLLASFLTIPGIISDANKLLSEPGLPTIFLLHLPLAPLLSSSLSYPVRASPYQCWSLIGPLHGRSFWKTSLTEPPSLLNSPTSFSFFLQSYPQKPLLCTSFPDCSFPFDQTPSLENKEVFVLGSLPVICL